MSRGDKKDQRKMAKDNATNNSGRWKGKGKFNKNPQTKNKSNNFKNKVEDFVFYIGSAKQASDYVNTAEYLINFIKKTYDDGNDIADALSEEREFPIKAVEPKLGVSSEKDVTKKSVEDRQNELKYNKRLDLFIRR